MKYRIFAYLVVAASTLLLIPSASATWSGFHSLGKTPVVGEPSCAQLGPSEVMCVARSQSNTLMANEFSKGAWSGWTNLSGTVTSDPSCVNDGTDTIFCGVTSSSNTLEATVFNGKTWSSFVDSGQLVFANTYEGAGPGSCTPINAGRVLCAARTQTGTVVASVFNGTSWGKFSTAATGVTSSPGCTTDGEGDVVCAVNAIVNNIQTIVVNRFDGAKWNGLINVGGTGVNSPACSYLGVKGQVDCFVRSLDTGVYVNHFNGGIWELGDWSGWGQITANVGPTTACALLSSGSIVCTWINIQDSLLYEQTYNGSQWTGYVKVGGPPLGDGPSCASYASGKAMCVVVGLNNQALSVTGP